MFVYDELVISPQRFVTNQIVEHIIDKSGDMKFAFNLIDPLSNVCQPNTGLSPLQDINRLMNEYRHQGFGQGGYWTPWDTKSTRGREELRKRLMGARLAGRPFANAGKPTIWVMEHCINTINSFKNWKLKERHGAVSKEANDILEEPEQKWSHMMMTLEAVCKFPAFKPRFMRDVDPDLVRPPLYFEERRNGR
jgi:hypothetical protein